MHEGEINPIFTGQFDFMDSIDEELAAILGEDFESPQNTLSSSTTSVNIGSANSSISVFPTSSTPIVLSFGDANQRATHPGEESAGAVNVSQIMRSSEDPKEPPKGAENMKRPSRVRPQSQIYDHIIAERKRREQLSNHFLALSTIVPGLKKMDKTSVLGEAITYLKYLQDRVKTLEEEATKKSLESLVLVKKSQIMSDDDEDNHCSKEHLLWEIEARVCGIQILIRIQCESRKGLIIDIIGQVEKLNLTIVNTNVIPFGMLALEITIIAKMEKEFNLPVNEVLKRLHVAIKCAP